MNREFCDIWFCEHRGSEEMMRPQLYLNIQPGDSNIKTAYWEQDKHSTDHHFKARLAWLQALW